MNQRWLLTEQEDDLLQGLSCEAQVIYMRVFRRYMDFDTGVVSVGHAQMKQVCEFIADNGSKERSVRVSDLTTHWARARVAELERSGLIEKIPKQNKFDRPFFRCLSAPMGSVRPEKEPQRNRKGGTASHLSVVAGASGEGTAKEPQGRNRNISGEPDKSLSSKDLSACADSASAIPSCPHQDIIALYHQTLPQLPRIVLSRWSKGKSSRRLLSLWRQDRRHRDLAFWSKFFETVKTNPHWLGDNQRGWMADLHWLLTPQNFEKVIQRMVNNQNQSRSGASR